MLYRAYLSSLLLAAVISPAGSYAQSPSAALAGKVSSAEESIMEGVLVSARREGSNLTLTVVTDAQGRYQFPAAKLEPGKYALTTRAVGYDLARRASVDVAAGSTA